jgi:hypothetical protein
VTIIKATKMTHATTAAAMPMELTSLSWLVLWRDGAEVCAGLCDVVVEALVASGIGEAHQILPDMDVNVRGDNWLRYLLTVSRGTHTHTHKGQR